jgi:Protein of unknown function (DUF3754)
MTTNDPSGPTDKRDQFIPVRKADVLDALVEHGPLASAAPRADEPGSGGVSGARTLESPRWPLASLASAAEREKFRQVCRFFAAIYHHEYFAQLERLRHDYFYFNPELDPHARFDDAALETAYADLIDSFTAVLKGAKFIEMSHAEVAQAHRERKAMRVEVEAPIEDFRDVRFFRRGHHHETIETPTWLGLRKESHDVVVYDDVILFVATRPDAEIASKRRKKQLKDRKIRAGSVLIKYFRNIAGKDLNALFPNVRVVMSLRDKLVLSVPALAGGIPILLHLFSTVTVLFLVIGFYLGLVAAVEQDHLKTAFAAMSGLAGLGGFIMRQWLRYQAQSLKYQKELTDNIYFRNVNNNAGIFDYMIGAAEEQECKEAFLAYYFLRTAKTAPTQTELEGQIEAWLKDTFDVDVEFEVDDALAKLDRLGLLRRSNERLSVPSPEATLALLDQVWGNYFQFEVESPATAAEA